MTKQKRLQLDTKETLELFIEKAEKAREIYISLVKHKVGLVNPLELTRNSDNELWRTHLEIESLLPTLRMFIDKWDGIAIYVVNKEGRPERPAFLDLPGMSENWHTTVEQAYKFIDAVLTITPQNHTHNNEPITRWIALETFIYGESIHTTQRKTLKQWEQEPNLYADLISAYTDAVTIILGQVMVIAEASKPELYRLTTNTQGPEP